jgi:lysophospholipid acyltransferase (LPLAT)-like uncharacterized protein
MATEVRAFVGEPGGARAAAVAAIADVGVGDAAPAGVDLTVGRLSSPRESAPSPSPEPHHRGHHRPSWRARVFLSVGGFVLALAMRVIGLTARKRFVGEEQLDRRFAAGEQVILAFWHGRMVMMPFAYRGRGACIMNSRHRDGELISRAIRRFGIEVVRGSSTRGWIGGLKGLLAAHARGRDLVVVPDGPRGPRCRAKSGVIQLGRSTGTPIFPVSHSASRAWVLRRSWDWLSIPQPFSRVTYVVADPIVVSRDATPEDMERLRAELERRLNDATRRADAAVGRTPHESDAFVDGGVARHKEK